MNDSEEMDNKSGNLMIDLSFELTRGDLFWYNLRYARILAAGLIFFGLMFLIGFALIINTPPGDLWSTYMWVEIGAGIGLSICAGSIGAIALQVFVLKNETINKARVHRGYRISSSGIEIYTATRSIQRPWNEIVKIDKSRFGYYFRTGGKLAIIIPNRELVKTDNKVLLDQLLKELSC